LSKIKKTVLTRDGVSTVFVVISTMMYYSTTMGLYFGTSVFMMHQPLR
jgi:hypothetical protein